MEKVHLIYYSPAFSTRKIVRKIGKGIRLSIEEHDITQGLKSSLSFDKNDLVVFGTPVFSGRIPAQASEIIQKINGRQTPAIIVCVYGNRDYDDALLELKDISVTNGFVPFAAGAFIARHSIFPNVAANRPDEQDEKRIQEFAERCVQEYRLLLQQKEERTLQIKGNHPYRTPSEIPLVPKGNSRCTKCGICVKKCPTSAIPEKTPRKTDKKKCITCTRCIVVCPENARNFSGLMYRIARKKFESAYSERKELETYFFT